MRCSIVTSSGERQRPRQRRQRRDAVLFLGLVEIRRLAQQRGARRRVGAELEPVLEEREPPRPVVGRLVGLEQQDHRAGLARAVLEQRRRAGARPACDGASPSTAR